ncbi:MAG: peptide deformylase [Candidatus Paceibacterota bacterium]|jgi:peptide deformylase
MPKTGKKRITILQKNNPLLRKVSFPVPLGKVKSVETRKIIKDLARVMSSQGDAIAISAVQIGKPIRLFMISKKAFNIIERPEERRTRKDMVFINPKITKTSKTKQLLEEGCLSVRYVYGNVLRSEKAGIEAFDENGKKFSRGFSGLLAQVVQHEVDHLNGILFIDKATDLQEVSPEEYEKSLKSSL